MSHCFQYISTSNISFGIVDRGDIVTAETIYQTISSNNCWNAIVIQYYIDVVCCDPKEQYHAICGLIIFHKHRMFGRCFTFESKLPNLWREWLFVWIFRERLCVYAKTMMSSFRLHIKLESQQLVFKIVGNPLKSVTWTSINVVGFFDPLSAHLYGTAHNWLNNLTKLSSINSQYTS